MSLSGLCDQSQVPGPDDVGSLLGASAERWNRLISLVSENHPPVSECWNFGGAKIGWTLRLKRRDRVILYMIPQLDGFLVGLVLGEHAWQAGRSLDLPVSVSALLNEAPRYGEGRGFRVPVLDDDGLTAIVQLVAAKMAR